MSFLPDDFKIQTFRCPNCQQYISANAENCKFCSIEISDEIKTLGLEREQKETKEIALKSQKSTITLGLILLGLSIVTVFQPIISVTYTNIGTFSCLTPIFLVLGLVATIYGLIGYLKEKNK